MKETYTKQKNFQIVLAEEAKIQGRHNGAKMPCDLPGQGIALRLK